MSGITTQTLAATGQTGNNSHAVVRVSPMIARLCVEFVVEVAGATPTVTFKLQGAFPDNPSATDWTDLILLPAGSETAAVSPTVTAVGRYLNYLAQAHTRFVSTVRLVTSANTNVTYSANLKQQIPR